MNQKKKKLLRDAGRKQQNGLKSKIIEWKKETRQRRNAGTQQQNNNRKKKRMDYEELADPVSFYLLGKSVWVGWQYSNTI